MKSLRNFWSQVLFLIILKSLKVYNYDFIFSYVTKETNRNKIDCALKLWPNSTIKWFQDSDDAIDCSNSEFICNNSSLEGNNIIAIYDELSCEVCDGAICNINYFHLLEIETNRHKQTAMLHDNVYFESYTTDIERKGDIILWFRHKNQQLHKKEFKEILRKIVADKDFSDHQSNADNVKKLYNSYNVELIKSTKFFNSVFKLFNVSLQDKGWYVRVTWLGIEKASLIETFYLDVINDNRRQELWTPREYIRKGKKELLIVNNKNYFILKCPLNFDPNESAAVWYHNDKQLNCNAGERILCTRRFLVVDRITVMDAGEYKCATKFEQLSIENVTVGADRELKVTFKEDATVNLTAKFNDTVKLNCKHYVGHDYIPIGWLKIRNFNKFKSLLNRKDMYYLVDKQYEFMKYIKRNNIEFQRTYTGTMVLEHITEANEGLYTCLGYNILDYVFQITSTYLSITKHPEFVDRTYDQVAYEGGEIRLKCQANGRPKPNITWYHNGIELLHCSDNCTEYKLIIKEARLTSAGVYKCRAWNALGEIEHSSNVAVVPEMEALPNNVLDIHLQISPLQPFTHESVSMKCLFEHLPNFRVIWIKSNRHNISLNQFETILSLVDHHYHSIDTDDYQNFLEVNNFEIIKSEAVANPRRYIDEDQMHILNVTSRDEGYYSCVVGISGLLKKFRQGIGAAELIIRDDTIPNFLNDLLNTTEVMENSEIKLQCLADGKPSPNISWYRNNQMLQCERRIFCGTFFTFEMQNASFDDAGSYKCKICNSRGCIEHEMLVKVLKSSESNLTTILIWSSVIVFISVLLFVVCFFQKKSKKYKQLSKQNNSTAHKCTKIVLIRKDETYNPENEAESFTPIIEIKKDKHRLKNVHGEYIYQLDPLWEISRSNIELDAKLGQGAFGTVVLAHSKHLRSDEGSPIQLVAVKMLKENPSEIEVKSLVYEMEVMKLVGRHSNIINFLGCCSQNGPLWVIVEYAPNGNLKEFLQKHCHCEHEQFIITEEKLISFAYQIANGMQFLSSKKCIHRDLAARNVLVGRDNVMKIADFGLARDLQYGEYYRNKENYMLPIKWMALESLVQLRFTKETDIWSYGVLLWEIWSYGEAPYSELHSTLEVYTLLSLGQRLPMPDGCQQVIYEIMQQCWNVDPKQRPSFQHLVNTFNSMLVNSTNVNYVELHSTDMQDVSNN